MSEQQPSSPLLTLDRPPYDKYEQEIVNGFPQIEALECIWLREVPPQLTGGYPIYRVYLGFRELDATSRELADRIQEAFEVRHHWAKIEFEFHHIPADRIPRDLPSRIWKREPRIWLPKVERGRR